MFNVFYIYYFSKITCYFIHTHTHTIVLVRPRLSQLTCPFNKNKWTVTTPVSGCPDTIFTSCISPFRLAASVSWCCMVMRKGRESSWSGPWHVGCTSEVFHVNSYQDQFIQPGWAECFCVFSLGLYFVYSFVFLWFVYVSPSFYVSLGS